MANTLKARKKITHKEIKQDKLVTAYFETKEWVNRQENRRKIFSVAGIIVVIVIAVIFYINHNKAKSDDAEVKLSAVVNLYDRGDYQEAISGDSSNTIIGLNE